MDPAFLFTFPMDLKVRQGGVRKGARNSKGAGAGEGTLTRTRTRILSDATVVRGLLDNTPSSIANVRRMVDTDPDFITRVVDAPALLHRLQPTAVRALLEAGADVNRVDVGTGMTLLNLAVMAQDEPWVRYLLSYPVALDLAPLPALNSPLGNAVHQRAYAIVEALLDAGATCGPLVFFPKLVPPVISARLLLLDDSLSMALFERLWPFADMSARRDEYLRANLTNEKVIFIVRRAGAPTECLSRLLLATSTSMAATNATTLLIPLLRAFVDSGGDPCAIDSSGRSLFATVQVGFRGLTDYANMLESSFDVNYVRPHANGDDDTANAHLGPLRQLDHMRECALARAELLHIAWATMEPYARPLSEGYHPDAITRYTGLSAEEYLALANQPRAALVAARGITLRMLRRWYAADAGGGRLGEARARFVGMLWAYAVIACPALMLKHRVHILASGSRRLRTLRNASLQSEVHDHVTNMPIEPDEAERVVVFSCSKVWDVVTQTPPPRFCIDIVNFAQHMSVRNFRMGGALTLNGIVYDEKMVASLACAYRAYKRLDPSRETWLLAPDMAKFGRLRVSFDHRFREMVVLTQPEL